MLSYLFYRWPESQVASLRPLIRSGPAVYQTLTMASEEMQRIRGLGDDIDWARVWLFYGGNDDWVGTEREVVLRACKSDRVVLDPDVPHAFCIRACGILFFYST